APLARRRLDDLSAMMSSRFDLRKDIEAGQELATAFYPVVHERELHLRHCRTFDADHGFAPVILRVGVTEPFVGDSNAAGESNRTVDHHELAMRAVIDSRDRVPAQGVVPLEINAVAAEEVDERLGHRG